MLRISTVATLSSRIARSAVSSNNANLARCGFGASGKGSVHMQHAAFSTQLTPFLLADIGEGIAEVEVMQWFVKVGDVISEFDPVCEVQSDKATVEITSRYNGTVTELCYAQGDVASVGLPLIILSGGDAAPADSGVVNLEQAAYAAESSSSSSADPHVAVKDGKVLCSPAVRRLAREMNIELGSAIITGTGPKGRILKEDLLALGGESAPSAPSSQPVSRGPDMTPHVFMDESKIPAPRASTDAAPAPTPVDTRSYTYLEEDAEVAIKGLQRIMVKTMEAANEVPTLVYCEEVEMDELIKVRAMLIPSAQNFGLKLSFLPFIIKATSLTLMHYPSLNAHTTPGCSSVIHKASHNIGIAMDTPRGLMVPNIKNVQNLSILQIASELSRLAGLGATAKLGTDDLSGGTFTLSNIGTIGGTYASPILVVPEVVIGALGKTQTLPRYDANMNLTPRKIMTVSWSADHRVVEGATIARFVRDWKNYMENPSSMILHTR